MKKNTLGRFRIGGRTLKTGLAVFIVIVGFYLTQRGNPFVATLAAVFAMRENFSNTIDFAKVRIISNTFGGVFAIAYFFINQFFNYAPWVSMFVLPLLLMLMIVSLDGFNFNSGIIGASAALLMISLTIPETQSFSYVIQRILDTFIGVFVAVGVNYFRSPKEDQN